MHARPPETLAPAARLDVGDTLCGELALLLRAELAPGQVIQVVARDPAAPQGPAGLVRGHRPRARAPRAPDDWIRRKTP